MPISTMLDSPVGNVLPVLSFAAFWSTDFGLDIKILDTEKSINVYKDVDEAGSSCCAASSCCVPSSKDSTDRTDVDLDEWAGETR